jgi:hypothetical protein
MHFVARHAHVDAGSATMGKKRREEKKKEQKKADPKKRRRVSK